MINQDKFKLQLLSLYWLHNDEEHDLCAHGKLFVTIGEEVICDENTFEITVSATALYLLRALEDDYKKNDFASQLLPCCGFNFMTEPNVDDFAIIIGCPSGIDFTIEHTENNKVKLTTERGTEIEIDFDTFKNIVLQFADTVENFYKKSKPKIIDSENDPNYDGYIAFWNEWHQLRKKGK